ncbi:MAG: UDP-N-acetyl-D-glucosamine dehydrogenase [Chloroflexi bacterium]|nr:UDP-N-acetyl-D-glucosamine dehydrogenase [Chloroflexota bacterium]|tara:strand:- start:2864 stop:4162 length:1299 start_codon:yes stop_codon:yes gene_type:complete
MSAYLVEKLKNKSAIISVVGVGYIGLPLLLNIGKAGFKVNGIDIDENKISKLKNKKSYISDISNEDLEYQLGNINSVNFYSNYECVKESDVIIVCVPTPLNKTKDPDISYIIHAAEEISKFSSKNKLISIESTVYPGATEELILPIFLNKNPKQIIGQDFFMVFSPERIDPGQSNWDLKNTPKVIGGITNDCTSIAKLLYQEICDSIIEVSSSKSAEMVKLLENTFRATNIGLVNEMAIICNKLGINIWEVIDAAKSKPYGFMPFYPGPGLGGHCIPIDPRYLEWKLETLNSESLYIKLAEKINFNMPQYVFSRINQIITDNKLNKKVFLMGVSYKPNVSDIRESPAIELMQIFIDNKYEVKFNDPYVPEILLEGQNLYSTNFNQADNFFGVITADHQKYDWNKILNYFNHIFDTRNALKNTKNDSTHIFTL